MFKTNNLTQKKTPLSKLFSRVLLVALAFIVILVSACMYAAYLLSHHLMTAEMETYFHLQELANMRLSISILGIILCATLVLVRINLDLQDKKVNERMRLMFEATPLSCSLWDRNHNIIDCNQKTMTLFGLSDKSEFLHKFFALSPQYQPCGKESKQKAYELLEEAFKNGYSSSEYNHQSANGELMPCEIILVRIDYRGEQVVAAYINDLRELKAMLAAVHKTEDNLRLALSVAASHSPEPVFDPAFIR